VVAATLTEIFYEVDRMRSTPVGEEELADARNYLSGLFSLGCDARWFAGSSPLPHSNGCRRITSKLWRAGFWLSRPPMSSTPRQKYFDSANAQI